MNIIVIIVLIIVGLVGGIMFLTIVGVLWYKFFGWLVEKFFDI